MNCRNRHVKNYLLIFIQTWYLI